MEKRRKTTSKDVQYLPPELLVQILSRLPVKSLLRFRCVSKSWHSMIDDVDFASMHLTVFNKNSNKNTRLLTMEVWHVNKGIGGFQKILKLRDIDEFTKSDTDIGGIRRKSIIIDFVCGVLLIKLDGPFPLHFQLQNLSIQHSLELPVCPIDTTLWRYTTVGFGIDPSSNDVKVVVVASSSEPAKPPGVHNLSIYAVSTGVWRSKRVRIKGSRCFKGKPLYCRGVLYWQAIYKDTASKANASNIGEYPTSETKCTHMVSFHLGSERFSAAKLPAYGSDELLRFSFLLGESIALFDVSPLYSCIWVLNDHDTQEPWTKSDSTESPCKDYKLFRDCVRHTYHLVQGEKGSNKILLKRHEKHGPFYNPVGLSYVYSYNLKNRDIEKMGEITANIGFMAPFVESLVLHNCQEPKRRRQTEA